MELLLDLLKLADERERTGDPFQQVLLLLELCLALLELLAPLFCLLMVLVKFLPSMGRQQQLLVLGARLLDLAKKGVDTGVLGLGAEPTVQLLLKGALEFSQMG